MTRNQFVNKQNNWAYLPEYGKPFVMVWAAIMSFGRSPLVFMDRGVNINADYYEENI